MNLVKIIIIFLLIVLQHTGKSQNLKVAIASSLTAPMSEITNAFETTTGIKVELIPGATGTLTHQLINGAPYDLLISANEKYCHVLDHQLITQSFYQLFEGQVVIWSSSALDTSNQTIEKALVSYLKTHPKTTLAIANPEIAPYGKVSTAYLKKVGLSDQYYQQILGNNISLVNQYISTESVDLALTSLSSQRLLKNQTEGFWYPIQSNEYSVAHCLSIRNKTEASDRFVNFMSEEIAVDILKLYGYKIVY